MLCMVTKLVQLNIPNIALEIIKYTCHKLGFHVKSIDNLVVLATSHVQYFQTQSHMINRIEIEHEKRI